MMSLQSPNPFETSTQPTENVASPATEPSAFSPSPPPPSQALQNAIPLIVVGSGFAVCILLWLLAGNSTVMRAAGVVVLLSDIVAALVLRRVFAMRTKKSAPDETVFPQETIIK